MTFCERLDTKCNWSSDLRTPISSLMPYNIPDSKVHGANMAPIWGRQDSGGPHVGPMNFAIWDAIAHSMVASALEHLGDTEHI